MDTVTVNRLELLEKVRKNHNAHRDLFLKAQDGFRARVIEELDDMLNQARQGQLKLHVALSPPQDHTAEYDRAIAMLEMHQADSIEINVQQFAQLVMNEWAWFRATTATNMLYASGGKLSQ